MSDLSRLLEDVYRSGSAGSAPSWSSDDALDEVFANWVPGPPPEACEAERAYANTPAAADELAAALELEDAPDEAPADPFEPLQALLEEALRRAPDVEEPDEVVDVVEVADEVQVIDVDEPEPESEPVVLRDPEPRIVAPTPVRGWSRADDDILPAGRARRGLLRRR